MKSDQGIKMTYPKYYAIEYFIGGPRDGLRRGIGHDGSVTVLSEARKDRSPIGDFIERQGLNPTKRAGEFYVHGYLRSRWPWVNWWRSFWAYRRTKKGMKK